MSPALAAANWNRKIFEFHKANSSAKFKVLKPNYSTHLCQVPLMIVRSPNSDPVPRSHPQLKEPCSQHVNLLLQLCEVPPDLLMADHQPLPVPECVGCYVYRLSNGDPQQRGLARPTYIAPFGGVLHWGLL